MMKTSARIFKTETDSSVHSSKQNSVKNSFFASGNKTNEKFFGPSTLQPKLEIGQQDDPYEREADRVADQVMRMPDTAIQTFDNEEEELQMKREPAVQMACEDCGEKEIRMKSLVQQKADTGNTQTVPPEIASDIRSKNGSGRPLPEQTQQEMSSKIGADFSSVRVHRDNTAIQLNRDLGAKAFTVGNNIFFNQGQYRPDSGEGIRLLAHELVHTVQQNLQSGFNNISNSCLYKQSDTEPQPGWCSPLKELVSYEQQNGTLNTIIKYNPANDDLLIPLNHDIPSVYGLVDVDWMLRLTYTQVPTIIPSIISPAIAEGLGILYSHFNYLGAKTLWNILRSVSEVYDLEFASVMQEANLNAPSVVVSWVHGESLDEIFKPALNKCGNK
jgi:DNA-directed RNA polymerase subunit M/transcription elongation factor TFIIS